MMDGQMDEHFQHYFTKSTLAEHLLCKCSLPHFSVLNLAPPLYLCHSYLVQNPLTSCLNFHNYLMNLTYSLMPSPLLCHDQDHLSNTKTTSFSCFTASTNSQTPTKSKFLSQLLSFQSQFPSLVLFISLSPPCTLCCKHYRILAGKDRVNFKTLFASPVKMALE